MKISIKEAVNMPLGAITPDFKSKEEYVLFFLTEFRKYILENKIGTFGDIIPSKKEISKFLKISTGTIQNAIKTAETMGLFASKQCIGTMITDNMESKNEIKMFSKKDKALIEIKKFLINHSYDENEIIPSIIELSSEIKTSTNTVRLAISELILRGDLRKEIYNKNIHFIVNRKIELEESEKQTGEDVKNKNLVKILKENIKKHLEQNYSAGDKIPSNLYFAKMYSVSIRTINSATKELNKEKIILSRRGKYGSIFLGIHSKTGEKSKFMSKPKSSLQKNYDYKWEKALEKIEKYILKNYEAGDKILSMKEFAKALNVSTTTIKRAVKELVLQGVLFVQKGKYGGLFIVEMPQTEESYRWLAINPKYFKNGHEN